ncbi:MAG TPA: YggS family pyridoxal phosphate-dependent enzyme [bacterium]|nr:YggS family pyridoxal phosphate-dependent enzyme [bacterium]
MSASIAENLAAVRERIAEAARRAGRAADAVRLLAVSKTKPAAAVLEAFQAGQRLFGENRVQEALAKMEETGPGPEWHLIGHLQSNKARLVPGRFAAVHSLDSDRLAGALQRHAEAAGTVLPVLIQLNLEHEASKAGIADEAGLRRLVEYVRQFCPHLLLTGLMTIPPPDLGEVETRHLFAHVRTLHAGLAAEFGLGSAFCELSMGMSHDFEWAIAEGSTMVRVGTAIFGERP